MSLGLVKFSFLLERHARTTLKRERFHEYDAFKNFQFIRESVKNNFKNSSHGFAFFIGGGEKLLGEIFVPKLSIRCIHKQIRN